MMCWCVQCKRRYYTPAVRCLSRRTFCRSWVHRPF